MPYPYTDDDGNIVGTFVLCEATYSDVDPPVPYGQQTLEDALYYEDGYKSVFGYLTEGHYLVFESNGYAVANTGDNTTANVVATAVTFDHDSVFQRWVLRALSDSDDDFGKFKIMSALDRRYITDEASLTSNESMTGTFSIAYIGGGDYTIQNSGGQYLALTGKGDIELDVELTSYKVYSVTYHT